MTTTKTYGTVVHEDTTPAQVAEEYGLEPAFVARLFEATFLAMLTLMGGPEKSPVQFGVAVKEGNGKIVTLVGGLLMTPEQADRVAVGTELGDVLAAVCRGDVDVEFGAVDEA